MTSEKPSLVLTPLEENSYSTLKGINYRLIATINFTSQTLFVEEVLTHAEYDKEDWK